MTLILGSLIVACSKGTPPVRAADGAPRPASASTQAPARELEVKPSISSVHIDPAIVALCNIPTPHFAFDSAAVAPDPALDTLAACMTSGPLSRRGLRLIGHADPRGEVDYNFALGQRRAGEVQTYLEAHGVPGGHIETTSRGQLDAMGNDEVGWAEDRRVDVMLASN